MPEERKLVTILFADVTGSTALGDTMDPEDVRALMSRYYAHARQIIEHHGGTLEKFIGDAVMAIFGLPQAHSDDAERALAAALALRDAVQEDPLLNKLFALCIGINTGKVIATNDLRKNDFLITGDAVNVAARLQQQANSGEILVGERTMHATQSAFLFAPAREVKLRGKLQVLQVYPLKESRCNRQVERPPFVGRRQDLMQLLLSQTRAVEEQRTQLVSIIAPAGTGKTRLLEEFLKQFISPKTVVTTFVRCHPYGQTITYWPLKALLKGIVGKELNRESIARIFLSGGYESYEAQSLANEILVTLGVERESEVDREGFFSSWRRLLELASLQTTRIIVFEDLHWASDSLLDLIEYLLHGHMQAPLLLVTLSRPELIDRRPHWGGGWQNYTTLNLQPLTPEQTRNLVQYLLKSAPARLQEQVALRSGGNPFFALELVRGIADSLKAGETPELSMLPDTIYGAIQARIDLLNTMERTVLQVASVSSRPFRSTTLAAVIETYTSQEIEQTFERLTAQDFLIPVEANTYTFYHVLIRDVAHNTLSRAERIRLHSKMAIVLEQIVGDQQDEYIELIAHHYRAAIRLAQQATVAVTLPIEDERAIRFLCRAAELANRAGAISEACKHLESALQISPASRYAALYEQLGDCLVWGDYAYESYHKALHYSVQQEDGDIPLIKARLCRKLITCQTRGHIRQDETLENLATMLNEAYQLVEQAQDEEELWHLRVAEVFYYYKHFQLTRERYTALKQQGLNAADYFARKGQWEAFSEALDGCTALALRFGAYDDAINSALRRLQSTELSMFERGDGIKMLAQAYMLQDNYDACINTVCTYVRQYRKLQPLLYLGSGICYALSAGYQMGRWELFDELLPVLQEIWEQSQHDLTMQHYAVHGYYEALEIALAHQDQVSIEIFTAILRRAYPDPMSMNHRLIDFILSDTPIRIEISPNTEGKNKCILHILRLQNERGISTPELFHASIYSHHISSQTYLCLLNTSKALAAKDYEELARAIAELDKQQQVVHAARMRVLLARYTVDAQPLELARPVFERLKDKRSLEQLSEVERSLKMGQAHSR